MRSARDERASELGELTELLKDVELNTGKPHLPRRLKYILMPSAIGLLLLWVVGRHNLHTDLFGRTDTSDGLSPDVIISLCFFVYGYRLGLLDKIDSMAPYLDRSRIRARIAELKRRPPLG